MILTHLVMFQFLNGGTGNAGPAPGATTYRKIRNHMATKMQ